MTMTTEKTHTEETPTYIVDAHGAKIYKTSPKLHTLLRVTSIPAAYDILSGAVASNGTPLLTVKTENGAEAIRVPECLEQWAEQLIAGSETNDQTFPQTVEFGLRAGNVAYAKVK